MRLKRPLIALKGLKLVRTYSVVTSHIKVPDASSASTMEYFQTSVLKTRPRCVKATTGTVVEFPWRRGDLGTTVIQVQVEF